MKKKRIRVPVSFRALIKLWKIMRLSVFFLFLFVAQTFATVTYSQQTRLTLKMQGVKVIDVLSKIEDESEFFFLFNQKLVDVERQVNLDVKNENIDKILSQLFENTNVSYLVKNRQIILTTATGNNSSDVSQQKPVSGKVTDSSGSPIPGVSVVVKGSTNGIITDFNGNFALTNIPENATLQFSFVGMKEQEVKVEGKTSINITLEEEAIGIEEVVAIGYGVQKKKLVTGSTIQVKGDEILKRSTTSPIAAMQSIAPGVTISKKSGQPGDGFKVTIRGIGTTGNSNPLYVVDGVVRGDIDYLTPSDIESIDILKDAASSAIYGARAANGVVLVTTKKGKANNKMQLSYDGFTGVQNVYKRLPLLNAQEYMMIQDEAKINLNQKPNDWATILAPGDFAKVKNGTWNGTNWLKEIENPNAPTQSHSINITGGNNVSVYSAGVSYTSQEGIYGYPVQSEFDRYSFRINSEHTVIKGNKFDILKIGENVSYTYTKKSGIATGNMWGNNIYNMIQTDPLLPMNALDATDKAYPYHYSINWNSGLTSNPVANMVYNNGSNLSKSHSLNANVYLTLQPIKNLIYRSSFSINPSFNSYRSWRPTYELGPSNISAVNSVTQNMGGGFNSWTFENTLNYTFSLNDIHHFNVLAGMSAERYGLGENLSTTNLNSVFNDFQHAYIDNANLKATPTIGGSPWSPGDVLSYFGRINYDYKETYLATFVMRADASSNFASGKRWSSFPSVSLGWVASNESFMQSAKSVVAFLKIRGSWGQNGNQSIPPFQYLSLITFNDPNNGFFSNYYFGSAKQSPSVGAFPNNLPKPELKWETSEQLDLGFDARFLNSKLSVAFDYYKKTTGDWLVAAPILASYGVSVAPNINGGEVYNKGIELALGWNDNIGDFKYGVNANMSYNKNMVTKIENTQKIIPAPNVKLWGNGTYIARAEVGQPIGYFYGYKTAGIFQNVAEVQNYKDSKGIVIQPNAVPGDVRFVDSNSDGTITDLDKVNIGDPNPDFTFSLNLNCAYKGFDFAVTTYGVAGNQIARSFHDGGSFANNYTTEILNRWHGEGTSNKIPRVTSGASINYTNTSDLFIENGSFLRIQDVTLGYDFKKIYKALPLEQLRLFFTAQNLYTFTKYSGMDPDIGTSTDDGTYGWVKGVDLGFYPNPRTFLIGASIKF